MLSACADTTNNVAQKQALSTINEADAIYASAHKALMLGHDELLAEIRSLRDSGATTNAELSRLLKLPTSRIADIFATDRKPRKITLDEAKILVEHFGLDSPSEARSEPLAPSADNLLPLLDALVPLAPPGRPSAQSLRALSEALSYGLALLGDRAARPANSDAIDVAARGAVVRFREIGTA